MYFETVDDYGDTNNPTTVKAHMFEAFLYMFWTPFASRFDRAYRAYGLGLDEALPFLYLHSESNIAILRSLVRSSSR